MKKILFSLTFILLSPTFVHAEDFLAKKIAKLGQPAPDFALQNLGGNTIKLSEQKGKIVMIHFWSATCPFVLRYDARLKDITKDYGGTTLYDIKDLTSKFQPIFKEGGKGVVVLGIDSNVNETADQIKKAAKERNIPYALLIDPDHKVADEYGAITTPHVFIINKEGVLAYEGSVDDQGWSAKNPVKTSYAREALDAVLAGNPVPHPQVKTFGCTIKRNKNK